MKKQADIDFDGGKPITGRQFRAIHVYFDKVADMLNEAGLDMRAVLKPEVDIPWSKETVKEYMWKPIQKIAVGEESSKDILQEDVDKVFNIMNRHLAKFGIHQPFPSIESIVMAMQVEDAKKLQERKRKKK
jgi:hypothetical protein